MDIHVIDAAGHELDRRALQGKRIWNPTMASACRRVRDTGRQDAIEREPGPVRRG